MAGIYIHIPFCKKACHYCNFHFSTSLKSKDRMLDAISKEIEFHKDYLEGELIETIYFGGGTPSLLENEEIISIIERIQQFHQVSPNAEVTLEANPDDLTEAKVKAFSETPINRLSIGIQSFFDEDLSFMNRAHDAKEAINSILIAQSFGFKDISIDLIYGANTTTDDMWQKNLDTAFSLDIPHISSYCLTVEPDTALGHFVKSGKVKPMDEQKAARQFNMLMAAAQKHGFEHYEISNFSKPNRYSKHNTAYWQGKKYLGIGPSAHSFNGESRQWNIANNARYMEFILQEGQPFFEIEILSSQDRYNEYVMTSLRTKWGCNIHQIDALYQDYFLEKSKAFILRNHMIRNGDFFQLTAEGKFLADGIASEMFWVE